MAIKATELRIGNIINRKFWNPQPGYEHYAYHACEVVLIKPDSVNLKLSDNSIMAKYPIKDLKPVKLGEYWLEKFSFIEHFNSKSKQEFDLIKNTAFGAKYDKEENEWYFKWYNKEIPVKYVHQLQNLYFALTGEELTLN